MFAGYQPEVVLNLLVMEHELFRHLEQEVFVRRSAVIDASHFIREWKPKAR